LELSQKQQDKETFMPAPMAGAPINFTSPTGGMGNGNGLLGLPSNAGLLGGIAAGLNSALDSYRSERKYQTDKQQQQKENEFRQNNFQAGLMKEGIQQGTDEKGNTQFSYSPYKIMMDAASRKYEGEVANHKAQLDANAKAMEAHSPTVPFPDAYNNYPQFAPPQMGQSSVDDGQPPMSQQFGKIDIGGLLKDPTGFLSPPTDDKAQEQYAANNSGPAPSGDAPPSVQSVGTMPLSQQPASKRGDFSGLADSPLRQKEVAEAALAKNKVKDYVPEGDMEQAKLLGTSFNANQNKLITIQDAIKVLKDPNQPMIAKAKAVEDAALLMRDSDTPGGKISPEQQEQANDLIKRIRTNPLDPGVNPDINTQVKIYENKMDLMSKLANSQQSAYSKLTRGKNLVSRYQPEADKKTSPAYTKADALDWLSKNPNDPKADKIRKSLGLGASGSTAGLLNK
jgi:hypothetical protein